ncbi:high mobility group box domain-containing protein, partial [Trametes gibbosa]
IPRPRNAFLIFRTDLGARVKANGVEHDHRMISKILGKVWRALPAEEKAVYQKRAAEEKREHRLKYPNYRFSPRQRTEKAKKR